MKRQSLFLSKEDYTGRFTSIGYCLMLGIKKKKKKEIFDHKLKPLNLDVISISYHCDLLLRYSFIQYVNFLNDFISSF